MGAEGEAAAEVASLKEAANAEFSKQQFLKAAALYTKAIKLDPENAVLFSNRSTALLKIKKIGKALEDAEEVIRLRPDWEKGYFRKAAVVEEQGRYGEAAELYQQALDKNPEGTDKELLGSRIKALQRLAAKSGDKKAAADKDAASSKPSGAKPNSSGGSNSSKPNATKFSFPAAKPSTGAAAAAPAAAAGGAAAAGPAGSKAESLEQLEKDVGNPEAAAFLREHMEITATELQDGEAPVPTVHFVPGKYAEDHQEQDCHVRGAEAFNSPETLQGFVDYVRTAGVKLDAKAVLSVTPKSAVAVPQTWTKPGWPCGPGDGVLFQLETREPRSRKLLFLPYDKAARTVGSQLYGLDADVFGVLPSLLR